MVCFALGNPGKKYALTRHNIGFIVAEALAHKLKRKFKSGKDYEWFSKAIEEKEITIVKPLLYMNNSGIIIKEYLTEHQEDFIVICDDFALPLGRIGLESKAVTAGIRDLLQSFII